MTKQTIFNKVVRHLRQQGQKSSDQNGCLYRGPNGTKCAIGCLIPDKKYNSNMEGRRFDDEEYFGFPEWQTQDIIGFLDDLRGIHDDLMVGSWEHAWADVATEHNLKVPA